MHGPNLYIEDDAIQISFNSSHHTDTKT